MVDTPADADEKVFNLRGFKGFEAIVRWYLTGDCGTFIEEMHCGGIRCFH